MEFLDVITTIFGFLVVLWLLSLVVRGAWWLLRRVLLLVYSVLGFILEGSAPSTIRHIRGVGGDSRRLMDEVSAEYLRQIRHRTRR
jgi:hypothetical protein